MTLPLMPKATAVWLIEKTSLTFEQIAEFTGMHPLEIQAIADGDVAVGIVGHDPIASGQLTREEIPHSVAVVVEEMERREDKDLVYIEAVIYVERESQKGIIIGKQGSMLKKIGRQARGDIERLLGTRVYLELFVQVQERWTERTAMLRELGYE